MENELMEQLLDEVRQLRFAVYVLAEREIGDRISLVVSTRERRAAWAMLDGTKSTSEIAERTRVSVRAIQMLVNDLLAANLIVIQRRGYPKRVTDFVPMEWKISE